MEPILPNVTVVVAIVTLTRESEATIGAKKGLSGPSTVSNKKVRTAIPVGVSAKFLCTMCIVIACCLPKIQFSAGV